MRQVADVLASIPPRGGPAETKLLPLPAYSPDPLRVNRIGLAVESMKKHTTDEGWQIFDGLQQTGFTLCGHGLPVDLTDVRRIMVSTYPRIAVVQDKREWDFPVGDFRDPQAHFENVECLGKEPHCFKLTILKDAHQRMAYHRQSAEEMGVHAWIVYYNPDVVKALAPYVRKEHLIRTYHSLDSKLVPDYSPTRTGCILSGALSLTYPMRQRMVAGVGQLPDAYYLRHPGYNRIGCYTSAYLKRLAEFKVAICTSSIYGYALRKIIEATACGCTVVTDLPEDEVMPAIDGNLVRVDSNVSVDEMKRLLLKLYHSYDPAVQEAFATSAKTWYDYRKVTKRLSLDIEDFQCQWPTMVR
jgi:hypothetical protein